MDRRDATGRYTVAEAAEVLGISAEAVRSRVKRGSLKHEREGNTVYVLLPIGNDRARQDTDQTPPEPDRAGDQTGRLEDLREQVAYLRRQLDEEREARRRADTILVQLSAANAEQARTIRAIEAPQKDAETVEEAPEGPVPRSDAGGPQTAAQSPQAQESQASTLRDWSGDVQGARRSLWSRIFGGR